MAEGDRTMSLDEVVELADAVAIHGGIASGVGTKSYGAQIVVEASSTDEAIEKALPIFAAAADRAGLPSWPVVSAEAEGDEVEMDWFDEIPNGRDREDPEDL